MAQTELFVKVGLAQNIGRRDNQEDAMRFSDPERIGDHGFLAVVSDGMGGMDAGEKFSAIAVNGMVNCFEMQEPMDDLCSQLLQCYGKAHRQALAEQSQDDGKRGGATVLAALVRNQQCAYMSVGDSRIDLYRGKGLIQLNRQQTLGARLDERAALGEIGWDEAESNTKRHAITNHIGRRTEVGADVCCEPFTVLPGDQLLLMSDGVFGTLSDRAICSYLHQPPQKAAEAIIQAVMDAGEKRQDNCSIMILSFEKR